MRWLAVAGVVFVASSGVAAASEDNSLRELQGEYAAKTVIEDGKPAPEAILKEIRGVSFKGDEMVMNLAGMEVRVRVRPDRSREPAHLDAVSLRGKDKGKTSHGIYKLEGKRLTLVMPLEPEGDRPKEFKGGEGVLFVVLEKREKKDEK
jgi:uncharacterized protein (TIGR03067 family)